jgi:flagellar assembly factor FliW
MEVDTKAYGRIDVDERQKVRFPNGLFGFENHREFVLLDAEQPPFYWLQSLEEVSVAFVLISPFIFRPDYKLEIPDGDLDEIELTDENDMLLFAIVTIPANQQDMTANLQGPLIINRKNKIARQSISTNPQWQVRHSIAEELARNS